MKNHGSLKNKLYLCKREFNILRIIANSQAKSTAKLQKKININKLKLKNYGKTWKGFKIQKKTRLLL